MSKTWIGIALLALLGACAPLSPAPHEAQAVKIEGTPGMGVIYLFRPRPDLSYLPASVVLDDQVIGSTHAGTYYRLEVPAGRHRLRGYAQDTGAITVDVQADRVYFIRHSVSGSWRATNPYSFFEMMDEARARAAMAGAVREG